MVQSAGEPRRGNSTARDRSGMSPCRAMKGMERERVAMFRVVRRERCAVRFPAPHQGFPHPYDRKGLRSVACPAVADRDALPPDALSSEPFVRRPTTVPSSPGGTLEPVTGRR